MNLRAFEPCSNKRTITMNKLEVKKLEWLVPAEEFKKRARLKA